MAIKVTKETDAVIKEMGILGKLIERCTDCNNPTRYWAYGGRFPLCQNCALSHSDQETGE